MTIQEIYELAVRLGIKADLRGESRVRKNLKRLEEKYNKLDKEKKAEFDKEKLNNPYSDTRIHVPHKKDVKKVLTGIDIGPAEVLLAKEMGDIDLIIAHHPLGKGLADLSEVMHMQAEILADYGVPINIAQNLLKERISEVARGVNSVNHYRTVDVAKLLNIGLINVHTAADNLVANFLKKELERKKPEYVSDVLKLLKDVPEYFQAVKLGFGPTLFAGSEDNYTGKIAVTEVTGGTEGSPKIFKSLSQAGIGTVVGMHMSEKHKEAASKAHINSIIAGHISSDSIGMNLFLDELEKKGIEIVPCSGLIRVKRFKSSKR